MDGISSIPGSQIQGFTPSEPFRGKIIVEGFTAEYSRAFLTKHGIKDSEMEQFVKDLLPHVRKVTKLVGVRTVEIKPTSGTDEEKLTITYMKNSRVVKPFKDPAAKIAELDQKLKNTSLSPEQKAKLQTEKQWYKDLQKLQTHFNTTLAAFTKEVEKTRPSPKPGSACLLRKKPEERAEGISKKVGVEREKEET